LYLALPLGFVPVLVFVVVLVSVAFAGDEILTGEAAKAQQHKNLPNTLQDMMRIMGLNFDELAANNVDPAAYPFKIMQGTEDGSNQNV
jgi:hypothetical protein